MYRSPRTITEEIYQDLKMGILESKFAPQEHLVERRLATMYGVSKTPVREALTRLEKEGLVKFTSLKGAVVRQLNKSEIIQILDIREYLDALAGFKAAELRSNDDLIRMGTIHADSELVLDNIAEFQKLDRLFHRTIREASGNNLLLDMSERLDNLFHLVLKTSMILPTRGPFVAFAEHARILQSIMDSKPSVA
ncbi:MAG: GntR family transcriptional regulator, partial [Bacilli bacterium]